MALFFYGGLTTAVGGRPAINRRPQQTKPFGQGAGGLQTLSSWTQSATSGVVVDGMVIIKMERLNRMGDRPILCSRPILRDRPFQCDHPILCDRTSLRAPNPV